MSANPSSFQTQPALPYVFTTDRELRKTKTNHPPELLEGAIRSYAINCLNLCEADAKRIETVHGLSIRQQVNIGIRSIPSEITSLFACDAIQKRFGAGNTWPAGFFLEWSRLRLHMPRQGLIVPTKRGWLQRAWLHYKHPNDPDPHWISSNGLPGGSKASASIHVCQPRHARRSHVCLLASDALRAEALASGGIVSVVGVNNLSPSMLAHQLREEWPSLRGVVIAIDEPDAFMIRALNNAGLKVEVA
jgi:hypothetical protein